MSSRGVRAAGTDGNDFQHRQRVAQHYQESVTIKYTLKWLFVPHILVLIFMWLKIGSELLKRDFGVKYAFFERLDLPAAYVWEYLWCFSWVPIVFAFMSFKRNTIKYLHLAYYTEFLFGIVPCMLGMGGQVPELIEYVNSNDADGANTPTFKGSFPMLFIWYIFFAVALQIHGFAMYFMHNLSVAWTPVHRD